MEDYPKKLTRLDKEHVQQMLDSLYQLPLEKQRAYSYMIIGTAAVAREEARISATLNNNE